MKIESVYFKSNSLFGNFIGPWFTSRNIISQEYTNKSEDADDGIDGLVIFSENQEVDRDILEVKASFDRRQKPVHKIDINGTLMVGMSNLDLWAEQSKCKNLLLIGGDELVKNHNLDRYITASK
jgi:hypothetical protein